MKRAKDTDHSTELWRSIQGLTPDAYERMRDAYFKAMESLYCLAKTTEELAGDAEADPLRIEHAIVCRAMCAMRASKMGEFL